MDDEELVETAIFRGEGTSLDLKRAQYAFESATDEAKSELLKDILAFANAWRSETAYIVVGVAEQTHEVVGLDVEIDDSRLQQFINGKTNRPVEFAYRQLMFRGEKIGLFSIPVQDRPTFVRRPYGRVAANSVYVRRGSSTAIADPDEIAKMGRASAGNLALPDVRWRVCDWTGTIGADGQFTGNYDLTTFPEKKAGPDLRKEPDFPDYDPQRHLYASSIPRRGFYRELAEFMRSKGARFRLRLDVENVGQALADDLRILLRFPSVENFSVACETELPRRPASEFEPFVPTRFITDPVRDVRIAVSNAEAGQQTVTMRLGKLHAGARLLTDYLYLTLPPTTPFTAQLSIYSDQLSAPINASLQFDFSAQAKPLTLEDLEDAQRTHLIRQIS